MDVEQLRKQAKELVRAARAGDAGALRRLAGRPVILANAQRVVAREHGYPSWPALVSAAEAQRERRARVREFVPFSAEAEPIHAFAREEAAAFGHGWLGSEHLLLGVLRAGGVASEALAAAGLTLEAGRAACVALVGTGQHVERDTPPTPEFMRALFRSPRRHAIGLGLSEVTPELVLLGILAVRSGTAACVLRSCAIDTDFVVRTLGLGDAVDPADYRPSSDARPEHTISDPPPVWSAPSRPRGVASSSVTATRTDGPVSASPREAVESLIAGSASGGRTTTDPSSVRFLKEREVLGRHLFAVAFDRAPRLGAQRHESRSMLVAVPVDGGGWRASHGCSILTSVAPSPNDPSVVLHTSSNRENGFFGAGTVYQGEAHVTTIRLRFADGRELQADSDDDLALFFVAPTQFGSPTAEPFELQTLEVLEGDRVIATQTANHPRRRHRPEPRGRLTPARDATAARWLVEVMRTFSESVTSIVPTGFDAYVRVFHPAYRGREPFLTRVSWTDIAAATSKKAHPAMQLGALTGTDSLYDALPGIYDVAPQDGTLPPELAEPLAATLARHTSTPQQCWFAAWNGFGGLRQDVRQAPTFELPNRKYHLLCGPAEAAMESINDSFRVQSPNLWWPDDRAWCVATDLDSHTTYIACDQATRDEILALPDIEALAIDPASGITMNSDMTNTSH